MTVLNLIGISDALANPSAATSQTGSLASFLPMILIFFVGAYFMMIRPQNKRVKAHQKLLSGLSKGDEVATVGGMVGKISKMTDEFITITVAQDININVQKAAISNVLPKGTLNSID